MANYNRVAALMGDHQEMAAFRRFRRLNMKSLLGMQAEILHLESEVASIEREDERSEIKGCSSLHESAFNLKASGGTSHDLQWRKVLEVRERLEQYSKSGTPSSRVGNTKTMDDARQSSHPIFARPTTPGSLHPRRSHPTRVAGSA